MAVLTNQELALMRKLFADRWGESAIDFDKATINAALQAIEDWYVPEQSVVSSAINTATSPYVFTNGEKKWIGGFYFYHRFLLDGV